MNSPIIMSYEKRQQWRNNILSLFEDEIWMFHPMIEFHVVSNTGKIKNIVTNKILKLQKNRDGYLGVNVKFVHKGRRFVLIHRLICEAFFTYTGVDNYFYEVNHIDGNKNNNNLFNLEWITRDENLAHSAKMRLFSIKKGEQNGNCKIKDKDIEDIRNFNKLGFTQIALANAYNVNRNTIREIVNFKRRFKK